MRKELKINNSKINNLVAKFYSLRNTHLKTTNVFCFDSIWRWFALVNDSHDLNPLTFLSAAFPPREFWRLLCPFSPVCTETPLQFLWRDAPVGDGLGGGITSCRLTMSFVFHHTSSFGIVLPLSFAASLVILIFRLVGCFLSEGGRKPIYKPIMRPPRRKIRRIEDSILLLLWSTDHDFCFAQNESFHPVCLRLEYIYLWIKWGGLHAQPAF